MAMNMTVVIAMVMRIVNQEHNRSPRKKKTKKSSMKQAKQNDMSSNSDENNNRMMKINNQPSYFKNKQEVEVEFKRKVKDEEVNQDKIMMTMNKKMFQKIKKIKMNNDK